MALNFVPPPDAAVAACDRGSGHDRHSHAERGNEGNILIVRVADSQADVREFAEIWKQAQAGKPVSPSACLTFESMSGWLETLTPARWQLLTWLRKHGPLAAHALAGRASPEDLAVLREIGLLVFDGDGRLFVPWDEIEAHLRLAA